MLLRRFSSHVQIQNWFAVFLDLIVVVVGLFIGLQIDNWWEGQKEARIEGEYLLEIREDFELNKLDLDEKIARLEKIIRSMIVLQEQSALATPSMSVSDLNKNAEQLFAMAAFIPVNRAFANLTGSGDLKLIQSRLLKNTLAGYYAAAKETVLVQNTHEMELVQVYEPYIIENLDYAAIEPSRVGDFPLPPPVDEAIILDVLATREFRNIMAQKWVISTDLLNQHREMLERTNDVLRLLD
jgi:ribosomal protein S17E